MFNVCTRCGLSHVEPEFDGAGHLVCSSCGGRRAFRRLPLLMVGGPAGAGKSTVGAVLLGELSEVVVVECDLLWRREFDTPEDGYNEYFRLWLKLAAHVSQSGRPVALFGAGFCVPHNVEPLRERRLFSAVHYLGLVCDDDELASRMRARPTWRNTTDELVGEHLKFNRWLKENAAVTEPPVTLLDTTRAAIPETAARVASWLRERACAWSRCRSVLESSRFRQPGGAALQMSRNPNAEPPQPEQPEPSPTHPDDPAQPEQPPLPPDAPQPSAPVREPDTPAPAGDPPTSEPTRLA